MKTIVSVTRLLLLAALAIPLTFTGGCSNNPSPQGNTAWGGAATAPIDDARHDRRYRHHEHRQFRADGSNPVE